MAETAVYAREIARPLFRDSNLSPMLELFNYGRAAPRPRMAETVMENNVFSFIQTTLFRSLVRSVYNYTAVLALIPTRSRSPICSHDLNLQSSERKQDAFAQPS